VEVAQDPGQLRALLLVAAGSCRWTG